MYDPRRGDEALASRDFSLCGAPHEPTRTNRFAVYRIDSGVGCVDVDAARLRFGPRSLLFCVPYQYLRFHPECDVSGAVIEFHANFLCVETFHAESGCAGTLFNDPYGGPVLPMGDSAMDAVVDLSARIDRELAERGMAHQDVALAYLKVLLVVAAREKAVGGPADGSGAAALRHPALIRLRELIEAHYREWHAPAEYAEALHMTPKTLGRIVREHLGTTLTDLIRARVLTHAKWQLLHTLRPVKEIAMEVGFADELYFSRIFKKAVGVSPTNFREFETEIRGGSNLSMTSGRPSIPARRESSDDPEG